MKNKDVLKIVLCSFGYDRNMKIETYRGDGGCVGYDVYAENKEGDVYHEICCEELMFHVYSVLDYMKENNVTFKSEYWSVPIKFVLDDNIRQSCILEWDNKEREINETIEKLQPVFEWREKNNPCPKCEVNKHDHWDMIHYNCELCHTQSCDTLNKFYSDYRQFRDTYLENNPS